MGCKNGARAAGCFLTRDSLPAAHGRHYAATARRPKTTVRKRSRSLLNPKSVGFLCVVAMYRVWNRNTGPLLAGRRDLFEMREKWGIMFRLWKSRKLLRKTGRTLRTTQTTWFGQVDIFTQFKTILTLVSFVLICLQDVQEQKFLHWSLAILAIRMPRILSEMKNLRRRNCDPQ